MADTAFDAYFRHVSGPPLYIPSLNSHVSVDSKNLIPNMTPEIIDLPNGDPSPKTPEVLLTGATGFIGSRVLLELLHSKHSSVRLAVRDVARAESLLRNPSFLAALSHTSASANDPSPPPVPTFVSVPDITAKGAYRDAVRDVSYVIHVASPLPTSKLRSPEQAGPLYIDPCVQGALEILEAAYATPSVKRVVLTSSAVALMPSKIWFAREPSDGREYGPGSNNAFHAGPYSSAPEAYSAAKTAQLHVVERWVRDMRPHFDVVTLHPSWVFGRNELARSVDELWAGTNCWLLWAATGQKPRSGPGLVTGAMVSVGDVARAHVRALDLDRGPAASMRFVLSTAGRYEDVSRVVERLFADEVREGRLSTDSKVKTAPLVFHGSGAEEAFGMKYESLDDILKGLLDQFLALKKEKETLS